jgi:hypothetical protein
MRALWSWIEKASNRLPRRDLRAIALANKHARNTYTLSPPHPARERSPGWRPAERGLSCGPSRSWPIEAVLALMASNHARKLFGKPVGELFARLAC